MSKQLAVIDEIVQGQQLITLGEAAAGRYSYMGNDSFEQWQRNRQIMGPGWYYWARPITYTVNSQNYRAPEWDQIDWQSSIVIYGCSFVFGDGIDDSATISSQLSRLLGRPVINLGAGGTSPMWQLHNQTLVLANWGEPWATVTLWPDAARSLSYRPPRGALKWGSWSMKPGNWADFWSQGTNPGTQAWMCNQQSRRLHQGRWVAATFDLELAGLLKIKAFGPEYMQLEPGARDLAHPGPTTNARIAEWIAGELS